MGNNKGKVSQDPEKENEKLRKTIEQLQEQLSKEMHTNVSANETSFENVQIQARPMKIGEEYANFCTDAWLEAKSEIDDECDGVKEIDKIKFLCDIILKSAQEAHKKRDTVWQKISVLLNEPVNTVASGLTTTRIQGMADDSKRTSKEVEIVVGDYFRARGQSVDIEPLVQEVKAVMEKSTKNKKLKKSLQMEQVGAYIEQACRICWKMALQRPPMDFKTPEVGQSWEKVKDEYNLDPQYGSDHSHKDAIIHCYVHPILYHQETAYGRTKVLVGPKNMDFKGD